MAILQTRNVSGSVAVETGPFRVPLRCLIGSSAGGALLYANWPKLNEAVAVVGGACLLVVALMALTFLLIWRETTLEIDTGHRELRWRRQSLFSTKAKTWGPQQIQRIELEQMHNEVGYAQWRPALIHADESHHPIFDFSRDRAEMGRLVRDMTEALQLA